MWSLRLDIVVADVVLLLEWWAREGSVALRASSDGRLTVIGDEPWLRQLPGSLVEDALEFSARG